HREGDGHCAGDGAAVRHGREAGAGGLGYRAGAVPGAAGDVLAAAAGFRPDSAPGRGGGAGGPVGGPASGGGGVALLAARAGAGALLAHETLEAGELPNVVVPDERAKAAE